MPWWLTRLRAARSSRGFSLIEIIVALAILSAGIVASMQLFSISLRTTQKSANYTSAVVHANSVLEEAYSLESPSDLDERYDYGDGFSAVRTGRLNDSADGIATYDIAVEVSWEPAGVLRMSGTRTFIDEEAQ